MLFRYSFLSLLCLVTSRFEETKQLLANNGVGYNDYASDFFGYEVDMDSDIAAIGSPHEGSPGEEIGAVYIFKRKNGDWLQFQKLTARDSFDRHRYGTSVAISASASGDYIAVGAIYDEDVVKYGGAVYVYQRENPTGKWKQTAKLIPEDAELAENGFLGVSVAFDGDTLFAGAYRYNNDQGIVFIYKKDDENQWKLTGSLLASDGESGDYFGYSISVATNAVVIGAYRRGGENVGGAYVFENETGDEWKESAILYPDATTDENFGISVGLCLKAAIDSDEKDMIAVGAHLSGEDNSGAVFLYQKIGSAWEFLTRLTAENLDDSDYFGIDVALSKDLLVVGAHYDDLAAPNAGAAYIFNRRTGAPDEWPVQKLTASDARTLEYFGRSVAVDGRTVLVGAFRSFKLAGGAGAAFVFEEVQQEDNGVNDKSIKTEL